MPPKGAFLIYLLVAEVVFKAIKSVSPGEILLVGPQGIYYWTQGKIAFAGAPRKNFIYQCLRTIRQR